MPVPAHLRKKIARRQILRYAARLLQFVLTLGLMGWFFYNFFGLDLVTVNQEMALAGQVTKRDVNRQHFNWYLNHDESTRYDFWSFEPGDAATDQLVTADSLDFMKDVRGGFQYYKTLGFYLEKGARLRKEANSPLITVVQDHRVTRWKYRP
ncbi:hypothetical protein [Hymenobacter rigui]|uniref:Uncharacterized protein n=1 Tax=Hymenobacter rigui TaxID=334424 RepID=A0A3R9PDT2_9BACT|nr:hypothetical protein [Hymenobacter rigui]RSK49965.1 hypothetical protein EI291_04770 [Hymenobacter rigui]